MTKIEKRAIIVEIGKCLDRCVGCPYRREEVHPACQSCQVYKMMRSLAERLEPAQIPTAPIISERDGKEFIQRKWTEEEENFLREYAHLGTMKLAELLGRPYCSVKGKIAYMRRKGVLLGGRKRNDRQRQV